MSTICKNKGFTLVEIIVVIVVMGIIMVIAIPSFLAWRPNLHFRQASRDFFLDLQKAKMEAVKTNTMVGVSFNPVAGGCPALGNPVPSPGGGYTIFYDDGAGGGIADDAIQNGGEQTVTSRNFPKYVAFCTNSLAGNLDFRPDGLPTAATDLTVQNDTGRQATVELKITGMIDIN